MNEPGRLAAFRIERRSVAAAILDGTRLNFIGSRQLDSTYESAETSAVGFVSWILSSFDIASAAMERFEEEKDILRTRLNRTLEQNLASAGVSVERVAISELLNAFGHPPVANRKEIREVVTTIWPMLHSGGVSGAKLDAVALGLYVQTERLFQN